MKKFFKDYKELLNHSKQFYKEHWLGTLVFTAACCAVEVAMFTGPQIKELIEEKIDQKKELE